MYLPYLQASRASLFDSVHMWLILENEILSEASVSTSFDVLRRMNLSVDTDVVVATNKGNVSTLATLANNLAIDFSYQDGVNKIIWIIVVKFC